MPNILKLHDFMKKTSSPELPFLPSSFINALLSLYFFNILGEAELPLIKALWMGEVKKENVISILGRELKKSHDIKEIGFEAISLMAKM